MWKKTCFDTSSTRGSGSCWVCHVTAQQSTWGLHLSANGKMKTRITEAANREIFAYGANNCLFARIMLGAAFFWILVYGTKQIPSNVHDQPHIPMRYESAVHVHQLIRPSIVCRLNPCSQQPKVVSAVHQRGCFPYWDKKLNLQEQRMLGLLQGGEAAALIILFNVCMRKGKYCGFAFVFNTGRICRPGESDISPCGVKTEWSMET